MSLMHAAKHVATRNGRLGRSYVARHGITLQSGAPVYSRNFSKTYPSREDKQVLNQPDEKLERALRRYKATVDTQYRRTSYHAEKLKNEERKSTKKIELHGYILNRRDVNKNLSFTMFRPQSQTNTIQLVSSGNEEGAEAHALLKTLREWTPVTIKGFLTTKAEPRSGTADPLQKDVPPEIKEREIRLTHILPLNEIPSDVVVKEGAAYGPNQRHLQLRTSYNLRQRLRFRYLATLEARKFLRGKNGFREIETPLLFKSTPEGAREFLVPTRNKGLAYALPQSPQQYKQLLMASGFDKYFQFAKCFRDEDLRADRQPEFTQLDIELGFANEDNVFHVVERLIKHLFQVMLDVQLTKIPRLTYYDAMSLYGSDKPDLRFPAIIHDMTPQLPDDLISKITPLSKPTIEAFKLRLHPDPAINRKFLSDFFDGPEGKPFLSNPHGQPATFIGDASQPLGGLAPLGPGFAMECPPPIAIDQGDVLVLQARPTAPHTGGSTPIGNLRTALHKAAIAQKLIDPPPSNKFSFVWITDFPLFTPTSDEDPGQGGTAGLSSTHHPFTAPKTAADVDLLCSDPRSALAAHYDIVVNGVELGGGSRRIHHADVQEFVFRDVLKMKPERIEDFRHLLDALRSGCPPHAGIALGWDRLMAVMTNSESVRDVIAFPKTGSGEDPLVGAPNVVTGEQWETYHLKVKE